jgi:hypothetical protein
MPGIESEPVEEFASAHPEASVTVRTFPLTKSFACGQLKPKPLKVTACPLDRLKLGLTTTLTVFEADRAPVADVVSPTVHVEVALAAEEPGENVAFVGAEADAACTEKAAMAPPSAITLTIALMSRFDRW